MVLSTLKRCKTADLKRQSEGCGECNKCWFMSKHLIFYLHRCCAFSSLTAGGWAFGDVWNKCIDWHRFSRFIILTWSCSGLFSQFQITRRAEVSWPVRVNTAFYFKSKNTNLWQKNKTKKLLQPSCQLATDVKKWQTLYSSELELHRYQADTDSNSWIGYQWQWCQSIHFNSMFTYYILEF